MDPTTKPVHLTRNPQAIDIAELENRFTYHPPNRLQIPKYETIRAEALVFAKAIIHLTPPCREQSLAITALEEAVYHANAAIARRT